MTLPDPSDLLAARSQMGLSLAFHILFAVAGIAMPLLMVIAEAAYLRGGDALYLALARRWARGTAILFAVGAVSGTVLSFELGLLWPGFMAFAGPIIGMPFSLEGLAFFTEAIFLGIYLYGWQRVPPRAHLAAGALVALSGAASAIFVVIANAWMNTPAGFRLDAAGRPSDIDPLAAMRNPAALPQTLHMILAAYTALGLLVAGIHAFALLRRPESRFHRLALLIALWVGGVGALLQPLSGDLLARAVAQNQPLKLAALEGHFHTQARAPLHIGGWPDTEARVTRYALKVPAGLSLLAAHDPDARVQGLDDFPRADWPNVAAVHISFQIMVMAGGAMTLPPLLGALLWLLRRRRERAALATRWYLWLVVLCAPLGMIAIEAGWLVTELGRQPWIIYGVLRTAAAVTPMPGLRWPFMVFSLLYLLLGLVVVALLRAQVLAVPAEDDDVAAAALAEDDHGHA